LVGIAGFSESFSDVLQNITSAIPYIRAGGYKQGGVGGGLRLPFRQNRTSCVPEELLQGLQTTLQSKAGHLVTVMDDWEQLNTNANLLKPTKHCHSLFRALQGHKRPSGKTDLAFYSYVFCCGVWIVHECSYKISQ